MRNGESRKQNDGKIKRTKNKNKIGKYDQLYGQIDRIVKSWVEEMEKRGDENDSKV